MGMVQPIAPDYGQRFLFPPALEDWVPADHPARFLREFVDQLDLPALRCAMPCAVEGRPPYAPSLLLKIWLYGYFHRIRSTRKLEAACSDHLSLVWLTGLLAPDHNSLWRFWKENKKALREVFKQTVHLAVRTGAVGLALQALDGTKMEAVCTSRQGWSKPYMEKLLAQLDAAVEEIEDKVVQENAAADAPGYRLPAGLADRQALREEIKKGLAQLDADGRGHYRPTEPEARRMKVGQTNRFAYNGQAVVDAQEGIVVACEAVRQENDQGQLTRMIHQARENVSPVAPPTVPVTAQALSVSTEDANAAVPPPVPVTAEVQPSETEPLAPPENQARPAGSPPPAAPEKIGPASQPLTLADTGYGYGQDLQAAAEQGLNVLVPPKENAPQGDPRFASRHFNYDALARTVTCPEGQRLDYEGHTTTDGLPVERYRCHCRDCPVRAQCTRDPKGRRIEIWPHTPAVQAMRQRFRDPTQQARYRLRSQIVERRFGQIKQHDQFRRWTVWGWEAVQTQWSLVCAILNLRVLYKKWQA
jgi:transposase